MIFKNVAFLCMLPLRASQIIGFDINSGTMGDRGDEGVRLTCSEPNSFCYFGDFGPPSKIGFPQNVVPEIVDSLLTEYSFYHFVTDEAGVVANGQCTNSNCTPVYCSPGCECAFLAASLGGSSPNAEKVGDCTPISDDTTEGSDKFVPYEEWTTFELRQLGGSGSTVSSLNITCPDRFATCSSLYTDRGTGTFKARSAPDAFPDSSDFYTGWFFDCNTNFGENEPDESFCYLTCDPRCTCVEQSGSVENTASCTIAPATTPPTPSPTAGPTTTGPTSTTEMPSAASGQASLVMTVLAAAFLVPLLAV